LILQRVTVFITAAVLLPAGPLAAQLKDTTRIAERHVIRWYEAAIALGTVGLATVADEPMTRTVQRHRSNTAADVATIFRQQGEPWYYATISLGVFGAGVVANSPDLRRAGRRLALSVGASGLTTAIIKRLVGRSRPNEGVGAYNFHPFTSLADSAGIQARGAFPSGHTTAAFAVATSLADDIHNPVASVVLYTMAAGAGWSRIYDTRHWLTDTMFGAILGITTAKIVSGRWRVFGWRPPAVLVRPTGDLAMGWTVPLKHPEVTGSQP
jgi:membrane-associated phospholipid phosphatase